jgi:hypothetical protein
VSWCGRNSYELPNTTHLGVGLSRFNSMVETIYYPFFQASPSAFLLRAKPASTLEPGLR